MSLICLVHGSTQNPLGWARLVPELEKRGHSVIVLTCRPTNQMRAEHDMHKLLGSHCHDTASPALLLLIP